jgi:hypothetical protein
VRRWTHVAGREKDMQTGFKTNIAGSRRWHIREFSWTETKSEEGNLLV